MSSAAKGVRSERMSDLSPRTRMPGLAGGSVREAALHSPASQEGRMVPALVPRVRRTPDSGDLGFLGEHRGRHEAPRRWQGGGEAVTLTEALAEWRSEAVEARDGRRMWTQHRGYIAACYPERVLALLDVVEAAVEYSVGLEAELSALAKALRVKE